MTNIKNLFGSGGHQTAVRKGLSETMGGSSAGGVAGLLNKFDAAGLGDKARSWVGDGQKQPVSGDEVRRALGDREVDQIAQKAGMPSNEASDELASIEARQRMASKYLIDEAAASKRKIRLVR